MIGLLKWDGISLVEKLITYTQIYLKNKKLQNIAFEKNVNNKTKSVSGMKYVYFSCFTHYKMLIFLTNDKPVIKIEQYGIIFLILKIDLRFPKIQRGVLRKITIGLLYFWKVYDVNLWEKCFGRSTAHSSRTNIFISSHCFKKKYTHSWRLKKSNKTF